MPLTDAMIGTALRLTGSFEDATDPWAAVSGDFDGQGLSLGVLQWTIGTGSLRPLVQGAGRAVIVDAMPVFGAELWQACQGSIPAGLAIVRAWQSGGHLQPAVVAELKTLLRTPAFQAQQRRAAAGVAAEAWTLATRYAQLAVPPGPEPSLRLFCWHFDLVTHNGGLKGLAGSDADAFLAGHAAGQGQGAVLAWLAARPATQSGFRDARRNADLWAANLSPIRWRLLALSYLRGLRANPAWQADTLNRLGSIVAGSGFVHGDRVAFAGLIPDTED